MNRTLFAFAAYNAGPTRMQQMRRLAAERIGLETTTYVRNILKYYAAHDLVEQSRQTRREALQALPGPAP